MLLALLEGGDFLEDTMVLRLIGRGFLPSAQRAGRIAFGPGNVALIFIGAMRQRLHRFAPVRDRLLGSVEIVQPDLGLDEPLPSAVIFRLTLDQLAREGTGVLISVLSKLFANLPPDAFLCANPGRLKSR